MAQLEEGWPLGLQPLNNVRANGEREYFGSASFNNLLSCSTNSSTDSSSDLDTESTGSFFHDKSNTLGTLIGVPTANLPSRRSLRLARLRKAQIPRPIKNNCKPKTWCFSLCPMDTADVARNTNSKKTDCLAPSLGQFLAVERRACNGQRRGLCPIVIGPEELGLAQPDLNSLFVDGLIAPPRGSPLFVPRAGRSGDRQIMGAEGQGGVPLLFSCMCG